MPISSDLVFPSVEPVNFGMASLDTKGHFVSMDAAYLTMLGRQGTSLLGEHWRSTVHPEDYEGVEAAYGLARTTGHGYVEIQALRGDSTVVYQALTVTGNHDETGSLTGYHCLRHDISRFKRDQEVLVLAVESAPNGLLILNSAGQIQSANRAVEKLFGYTRDELLGCVVEKLVPVRFRGRHAMFRESFNRGESTRR